MRILICGDRNWTSLERIRQVVTVLHKKEFIDTVIEGEARGADTCGRIIAEELDIPVLKFPADWLKYGRAAGPIRNSEMLKIGRPNLVLAFHNDILKSKGTKNMCEIAKKAGISVYVYTDKGSIEY
jgi:hypothetical protein